MIPLSELISVAGDDYIRYLSRKTGFLITRDNSVPVQWLWMHMIRDFDFSSDIATLRISERECLDHLLHNFGYLPGDNKEAVKLEKILPWVFRHPTGGFFIPVEIFKSMMQEQRFHEERYLFSLLYRLPDAEQKSLASLQAGSLEGQMAISFEKHPLDMALVLYLWIARHHSEGRIRYPDRRGRVLKGPFSFLRETDSRPLHIKKEGFFPEKPVNAWEHLYRYFPHQHHDIDELRNIIRNGRKGFYRSLGLIKRTDSELFEAFKWCFFLPVLPRNSRADRRIDSLKLVSPVELKKLAVSEEQNSAFRNSVQK